MATPRRLLLALATAALVIAGAGSAQAYTFVKSWGSPGFQPGQFDQPAQIAVDPLGDLYAADETNNRIQKFAPDGTFIAQFGQAQLHGGPYGVTVDPAGMFVYVTDAAPTEVEQFTSDGTFVRGWGPAGSGDGDFVSAADLAVGAGGNVYVADGGNDRVQEFTADGTFIRKWGSSGTGDGQFDQPDGVSVDSSGQVYVTEDSGNRVQVFTPDGTFIRKWGTTGAGNGQLDGPFAVSIDPAGNVWVADANNHRIDQFTADGTFLSSFGNSGTGEFGFDVLSGVAVDCHGIYAADSSADRISLFADNSIAACPQPPVSPQPPAAPPARDTTAPAVSLSAPRNQHVLKQRGIRLTLSTNEAATFTASATGGKVRFKRVTVSLAARGHRTLKLGLSAKALKQLKAALRKHSTLKARLVVTAKDTAGNATTKRKTVTVRR